MTSNKRNWRQVETTLLQKIPHMNNEATGNPVSSCKWNGGYKLDEYKANK